MKAIRHQITRAKREMVVLLLMLAVSAAALTTGVATAQSPTGAEAAAVNPCEGLSPLTMIVSLPTLDSSGGLTKETTDPSGECTFALTLTSVRSAQGVADNSSAACTVTATPTPKGDRGVSVAVQVSGDCQGVQVASRVTLAHSSGPAIPAGVSGASATVPHRVVTAQIGARQPYGERFYHGVRAHWTRSGNYVRVLSLSYPHKLVTIRGINLSHRTQGNMGRADAPLALGTYSRAHWYGVAPRESMTTTAIVWMYPNLAGECASEISPILDGWDVLRFALECYQ